MAISGWPADERPREKLLARGAQSLADAELLAIFLRTGLPGVSAVELARQLLAAFGGSLARLFAATQPAFCQVPGLGAAKYAQLMAVRELAERAIAENMRLGEVLDSSDTVRAFLRHRLGGRMQEVFMGIALSAEHRVLVVETLFTGTLTEARVYPRELVKWALAHNAAAVIVAHNHPSGALTPSAADRTLTDRLCAALALVEVRLLDHILVAGGETLSFAELGYMH